MRKEVKVGDRIVALECNAATPFVVKRLFDFDVFRFFEGTKEMDGWDRVPQLEQLAYAMAMQAEKPLSEAMNCADGFYEWLAGFAFIDILEELLEPAVDLWTKGNTPSSKSKNPQGPQ